MKEEKFKVIQFIRNLIVNIDSHLENFPKKDIELKNRIRNNSYDILEIAYKANYMQDEIKKKELIGDVIAKVKTVDFLLNLCYDKRIINSKRYVKFGQSLDDILKYSAGWVKSIKQGIVDKVIASIVDCILVRYSRAVNVNSNYTNFNVRNVNNGNVDTNNLFNSNGNENDNYYGVRPVDSINCGYAIINCMRDNIETNYIL